MPLLSEGRVREMWEAPNKVTTFLLHQHHPELNSLSLSPSLSLSLSHTHKQTHTHTHTIFRFVCPSTISYVYLFVSGNLHKVQR